jgi:hypothetical protein
MGLTKFEVSDITAIADCYGFSIRAKGAGILGTFQFPSLPQAVRAAEEMREMFGREFCKSAD